MIVFIGIGSNLGNPVESCREALRRISSHSDIELLRSSSLYMTEPVGPVVQPWFVNCVCEVNTSLEPRGLFLALKNIEQEMGRRDGAEKWGPRLIDLDLLLYGQIIVSQADLVIPHPQLHRRRFVLIPLCELASYTIHPVFNVSAKGLLERLGDDPHFVGKCYPADGDMVISG